MDVSTQDKLADAFAEHMQRLMKKNGLNLIWPAMHEKGYEFTSRPENMAQAAEWGITVGTTGSR